MSEGPVGELGELPRHRPRRGGGGGRHGVAARPGHGGRPQERGERGTRKSVRPSLGSLLRTAVLANGWGVSGREGGSGRPMLRRKRSSKVGAFQPLGF